MIPKPILVVADSRGRFLQSGLQHMTHGHVFNVIWKGGLRLDQVTEFAFDTIVTTRPKIVYVLCGICNLTRLTSRHPNRVTLYLNSVHELVMNYMCNVDLAMSGIFGMHRVLGYKIMVVFPTQTGMDIGRYNRYPPGLFCPFQPVLNAAILRINRAITALNQSMAISTPFLATVVHPRCRRRNRFAYCRLYDGCHLSHRANAYWVRRLHANAMVNLARYDSFNLSNSIS